MAIYAGIIQLLKGLGCIVLTEHVGNANITQAGESAVNKLKASEIYEKDCRWLREADIVIAEVTQTSLGVGYELGYAESLGKPIVCLYRPTPEKVLTAMLRGNPHFKIVEYAQVGDLEKVLSAILKSVSPV